MWFITAIKKWSTWGWSIPLLYGWPPSYCSAACSSRPSSICTWGFLSHGYPKKEMLVSMRSHGLMTLDGWIAGTTHFWTPPFLCICQCCIWTWVHNSFILQASGRLKNGWIKCVIFELPSRVIKYGGFGWKINYINGWCSITMFDYQRVYSSSHVSGLLRTS